jgi:hypothetical protein
MHIYMTKLAIHKILLFWIVIRDLWSTVNWNVPSTILLDIILLHHQMLLTLINKSLIIGAVS